MATRYMQTDFWTDSKVHNESSPEDRYFMIYLLTNPKTNQLGCYELTIEQMAFDLGYKEPEVDKILNRLIKNLGFADYDYDTKEILIKNWYRYNWTKSPKVQQYVLKELEKVKSEKFRKYLDTVCIPYVYPIDTLCIGYRYNYNNKNNNIYNYNNTYRKLEEFFGRPLSSIEIEIIKDWEKKQLKPEIIELAIKEAILNQARSLKYIDKILYDWAQQGLKNEQSIVNYLKKRNKRGKEDATSSYETF